MNNDIYMTVDELAKYLGFEKQTLYNKIHKKEIPFHKIGPRAVRFIKDEIDRWIEISKQEEHGFIKIGDKYYFRYTHKIKLDKKNEFTSEVDYSNFLRNRIFNLWHKINVMSVTNQERLVFTKEDSENISEIIRTGLDYPMEIINELPVYNFTGFRLFTDATTNYVSILKLFKGKLNIESLFKLKNRVVENVKETLFIPEPEEQGLSEDQQEAFIGFHTEYLAQMIIYNLFSIICYLDFGVLVYIGAERKRMISYANRYFNKETFWDLYLSGFCNFVRSPMRNLPVSFAASFFLKNKPIEQLTSEQIEHGLKINLFTIDEIKELLQQKVRMFDAESKALKQIIASSKEISHEK